MSPRAGAAASSSGPAGCGFGCVAETLHDAFGAPPTQSTSSAVLFGVREPVRSQPSRDALHTAPPNVSVTRLEHWYRGFGRSEAMLELLDMDVTDDPRKVFAYMDKAILNLMTDRQA